MAHPALRVPQPRRVLHFVSLRTAAEFINLSLVFNKVTGLYGVVAIFTGYALNPLQVSHYVYSLAVLAAVTGLMPSMRRADRPLRNLALAYVYVLDAVVNGVYTAVFGTAWSMVLSAPRHAPGAETAAAAALHSAAGFTAPAVNVTRVDVLAQPASGLLAGQDAVAYGHTAARGGAALHGDSVTSIALLALFTLVRIYFCVVVLSYARAMLRQYVAQTSDGGTLLDSRADPAATAPSPFAADRLEGSGWRGRLGRLLLRFPSTRYWLARDARDPATDWERATGGRFPPAPTPLRITVPEAGVGERERRARSGTGPPLPKAPE